YLIYIFRDEEDQTHRQQKLFYIKDPDIDDIREVYLNRVIVAWVYWNEILEKALYFGDSRHGSEWNPQMHWMLHQTINSQWQEGISIIGPTFDGAGTLESDYLLEFTYGKVWHDHVLQNDNAVTTSQAFPVWYIAACGKPTYDT